MSSLAPCALLLAVSLAQEATLAGSPTGEPSTVNFLTGPSGSVELPPLPNLPPGAALTLIAGDLLHVTVFRQKDLELQVRVPEGGSFGYPLIDDIDATGKSVKAVEADIQ